MSRLLVAITLASLTACTGLECDNELPYDGIDQDCDGSDLTDVDGDGFDATQAGGTDCNDGNPDIHPEQPDIPYDGIDQDCSGSDLVDADGDGFNYAGSPINGDDCDDDDASINPNADDDVGNGTDDNCDGIDGTDLDGDGYAGFASGGDDCNDVPGDDGGRDINPGATEIWYDGIDQDCAGDCDYDQDGDGFLVLSHTPIDNDPCDAEPKYAKVAFASDCDDTNKAATDNFLQDTTPPPGDIEAFGADPIRAQLTRPEAGATLVVTDDYGKAIVGTTRFEGNALTFYPEQSLDTFTAHDATITWSCGAITWAFTVGAFGPPVTPSNIADATFDIALDSGFVRSPVGIGPTLEATFNRNMLLTVPSVSSTNITLFQSNANEVGDDQDQCIETASWGSVSFSDNPEVTTGSTDLLLHIPTGPVLVRDATLTGFFSPLGDTFGKAMLQGEIDTRDFVDATSPGSAEDALCVEEAKFGNGCVACSDGTGDFCLDLILENLSGTAAPTISAVERSATDIASDGTCTP